MGRPIMEQIDILSGTLCFNYRLAIRFERPTWAQCDVTEGDNRTVTMGMCGLHWRLMQCALLRSVRVSYAA
jgi:hypothetical protein